MDVRFYAQYQKQIIEVLSKYLDDCDIDKIKERLLNNTDYYYLTGEKKVITLSTGQKKTIRLSKGSGKTNIYGSLKEEIVRPVCAVRVDYDDYELTADTIIHELIHVASISQKLLPLNKKEHKLGFITSTEEVSDEENAENFNRYDFLNECMTEMIAKFINDNSYEDKYFVIKEDYELEYSRGYFMLAHILLNSFEEDPKEILQSYFNNDVEAFGKILEERTDYNLDELLSLLKIAKDSRYNHEMKKKYKSIIESINSINPLKNEEVIRQYKLMK